MSEELKPIRKVLKLPNELEEEYFLCPKCGAVLEWGEQCIDAMYDDITPAGEAEVDYLYCPECGWDNEEKSMDEACEALGGLFWY
jgi:rubredoxin